MWIFTFLEIVADNGLEQIVDFPTRKDNTLDLMLLSQNDTRATHTSLDQYNHQGKDQPETKSS
jgi:hypothetical protein